MTKFLANFFESLKKFRKSPNLLAWWTILLLVAALFVAESFFLPWFLIIIAGIVLLGLGIFVTSNQFSLAGLNLRDRFLNNELTALIQNLSDGLLIYDSNFKILNLNQAAAKIFDLEIKEIVGRTVSPDLMKNHRFEIITQIVFPSLAPTATQISENVWPQIVDINLENPILKLRTVLNKIVDEKGQTLGFLKLIHDQTRETDILESKSEFIATAAHQLRTPLTAINWVFESLSKDETKPELKELSTEGLKLAERSLKIINDLLDTAKIEEGRFGYRFEEINLNELIEGVLDQAKTQAQEYGIKLYFSSPQSYKIKADAERLNIALSNLIDNAIKYNAKNGSVTVALAPAPKREFVEISIADTGVGIPENEIKKLFGKFYRGANVIPMEPNGSGLGLYITKNIIEAHGGKIGLESIVGRGTTFSIVLPLTAPDSFLAEK